jgi:hypothetical protein
MAAFAKSWGGHDLDRAWEDHGHGAKGAGRHMTNYPEEAKATVDKRRVRSLPGRLYSLTCAPFLRAMT